jgi:hypothetical protein
VKSNKSPRRQLNRRSVFLRAAVAASASLVAVGAPRAADAGLMVDLRALDASGAGHTVTPKSVVVEGPGVTVTIGVYARLSGLNGMQIIADLDGDGSGPANDTTDDESLSILTGSFQSVGSLHGNMNPTPGVLAYDPRVLPFRGIASTNGAAADWDSDGDLDIGNNGTSPAGMWSARARTRRPTR